MKRFFFLVLASLLITTAVPSVTSASSVVGEAHKYLGAPYQYGGTTSAGFDCSGFTQQAFSDAGSSLPRTTGAQFNSGTPVDKGSLQPGDLVFFNTSGNGVSHAGIYIGSSNFIHASSSKGVMISSINDPYYWGSRYIGARRVVGQPAAPAKPKTEKAPEQKVEPKKVEPKVEAKPETKVETKVVAEAKKESKPVQKAAEPVKAKAEPKATPVPVLPVKTEQVKEKEVKETVVEEVPVEDAEEIELQNEFVHLHPTAINDDLILLALEDQELADLMRIAI